MNMLTKCAVLLFAVLLLPIACSAVSANNAWAAALELTEAEKLWLAEHPVLKSPTTSDVEIPPIYIHDAQGNYAGVGVDIAELVARKLGIRIEWVDYNNQVTAIDALIKGDVDFISFMGEGMVGEGSRFILSSFFHQFPTTLVVPKTETGQITIDSLRGKRVAAVRYWPDTEFIKKYYSDIEVVETINALESLQKVAFGEVDAAAIILPIAAYEIRAGGITTLRIGGRLDRIFRQGFGIREDSPELLSMVNKALASMTEQEKSDLYNKWVPVLVSDGADYKKWFRRFGFATLAFFIVFCGVVYWNRKLSQANLAERQARAEARHRAEEALEAKCRMEKAVKEEQALRKKQVRFVDMISHECRTPVAVLQANLDILHIKHGQNGLKDENNFANMQYAISRLTELLDSNLDKVQSESGALEISSSRFSLKDCVNEALENICSLWPDRNIGFSSISDNPLFVVGDRQLIKTALLNLIENGLKYSPAEEPVELELGLEQENGVVMVLDRGIGISQSERLQVFEKYYRSDRGVETSGTGVGLFLVKKTVELHGGTVFVAGREGGGTVMTMILPLCRE